MGGGMQTFQNEMPHGMKRNRRMHPGVAGPRPDRKAIRRREAAERMIAYQQLPIGEKIKRNPNRATRIVELSLKG